MGLESVAYATETAVSTEPDANQACSEPGQAL